jgi:histidinol-phosphate aminotransferase
MIPATPHIAKMQAYALADMPVPDGVTPIALAQNESLRPPSPKAIAAATAALQDGALYPDPDWADLRAGLAATHGIPVDGILCGCGSLDLIGCLARSFTGPDRAALAPAHAYPFFRTATELANARFDTAPEVEATVDIDALLAAVKPDTGVVLVANPGNPTGTRIDKRDFLRLRASLRDDILLVIDEAYGEFADHLGEPTFDMVAGGATVVLRTFSKAYGLAGYRIGWGLFPPQVAGQVRKAMNPNNITGASQAAALAALSDQAYMRETCALTAALRDEAATRLNAANIRVGSSHTNFLLIDVGSERRADAALSALQSEGIFLRKQGGAGLPQMLRMTVGPRGATVAACDALSRWRQGETL